jgi:hypothetical protein
MRESGFCPLRKAVQLRAVQLRDSTMRDTVEVGLPGTRGSMAG